MSTVGDILSTVGVFSTMGDIMINVGRYLEYREGCSVPWRDIMSTVGVTLSTVGDIMLHMGRYHEYRGVFSTVGGYHPLKFEYRGGYHDTCGGYHEYRGGVQYRGVLR